MSFRDTIDDMWYWIEYYLYYFVFRLDERQNEVCGLIQMDMLPYSHTADFLAFIERVCEQRAPTDLIITISKHEKNEPMGFGDIFPSKYMNFIAEEFPNTRIYLIETYKNFDKIKEEVYRDIGCVPQEIYFPAEYHTETPKKYPAIYPIQNDQKLEMMFPANEHMVIEDYINILYTKMFKAENKRFRNIMIFEY